MFYDNLKAECDKQGLKLTTVVLECGGTKGVIGGWKNGAAPRSDIVMKLAVRLNVPTDSLLFGNEHISNLSTSEKELISYFKILSEEDRGRVIGKAETLAELTTERAAEQDKAQYRRTASKKAPLPFPTKTEQYKEKYCYVDICALPAGAGTGVYLDESGTEPLKIVHTSIADRANYAIRVSGDSMEPKFHDGDIVLVETCPSINIGEIGIFIVNGEGFIKQYDGDTLISLNPKRKNIHLQEDDTVFCRGRVLGIAETAK